MYKMYSVVKVLCLICSDVILIVCIMTNIVRVIVSECQRHLDAAECEKIL